MAAVLAPHDHAATDAADQVRQAYNSAFEELGLPWSWDRATCATLPLGPDGVRQYVEREHPHLLAAYEADFLVNAIEAARTRCQAQLRRHA